MRTGARRTLITLAAGVALLGLAAPALAGTANAGLRGASRSNPLAGVRWGAYPSPHNSVYAAYQSAGGADRRLLAKIALRPTVQWFGPWVADAQAESAARDYAQSVTGGDPAVGAQYAVFRLDPWEDAACSTVPGATRQASFRSWIDSFARGIGTTRSLIVLQPDLPFALCSPGRAQWLRMVAYATARFSALAHATVYVDAGAYQWISPAATAAMLQGAGISGARGFSLDDTEYDTTARELGWGQRIERQLAARGLRGKHFLISTSMNGVGFLNGQYHGNVANARVCRNPHDSLCVTLGIPPTTDVASPRWQLDGPSRSLAAHYVDAYVWVGRPWLDNQADPFDLSRALGVARSTPF
ncbi:MAG TPA: glycoside hydrolase family 6 protein [Solirubrobacteraceae bacterium]|nr:glycoside hydrolase family 6 protein [Solirubrobacteraceae bacterium]